MLFRSPVWTATQAARRALSKELVTIADIAESYEKSNVADVIIALCQTREEKEADMLRLFAAKIRDGGGGWMVKCHMHSDSHAIITEGMVTMAELVAERTKREEALNG